MQAALTGDQNSYRLLLTELRGWLTAYYTKRIHRSAVEDLVQDTLMTVHAKRETFDPSQTFGPWVSAIARHRWIDHMRKTLKYVEIELDDQLHSPETVRDECAKHDVQTLLRLIPQAQADIITMVKIRELSVEEVSRQTGHSPSSVKIMVHRGMKRLMAAVAEVQDD